MSDQATMSNPEVEEFNAYTEVAAGWTIFAYITVVWAGTSYVAWTRAKTGERLMPTYEDILYTTRRATLCCTDRCTPRNCCCGSAQCASKKKKKDGSEGRKRKGKKGAQSAVLEAAMEAAQSVVDGVMEGADKVAQNETVMRLLGDHAESSEEEDFDVDGHAAALLAKPKAKKYVLAGPDEINLKRKWDHPEDMVEEEDEVMQGGMTGTVRGMMNKVLPRWLVSAMFGWLQDAGSILFEGYFFIAPSFKGQIRWNRSVTQSVTTYVTRVLGGMLAIFDPREATDNSVCEAHPDGSENTTPECLEHISRMSLWKYLYWTVILIVFSPLLGFIGALPWGIGPYRLPLFGRTTKWGKIGRGRQLVTALVWLIRFILSPLLVPFMVVGRIQKEFPGILFKTTISLCNGILLGGVACRYANLDDPNTSAYLVADPSVQCWKDDLHWAIAILAMISLPVFIFLGHQFSLQGLGGVEFDEPSQDHERSGLKGAGVPPFKLYKKKMFYNSWWAEFYLNMKMILSSVVALLGTTGREEAIWAMMAVNLCSGHAPWIGSTFWNKPSLPCPLLCPCSLLSPTRWTLRPTTRSTLFWWWGFSSSLVSVCT